MRNSCPPHDTLAQFLSGTLPEDQADSVLQHLDGCADCESAVESFALASVPGDGLVAGLRGAASEIPLVSPTEAARLVDRVRAGLSTNGHHGQQDTAPHGDEVPVPEKLRDYELLERLGDNERNEAGVMQRKVHRRDEFFEHVSDCSHNQRVDGTQRKDVFGSFPMEQSGGTLRLVRRGDTVHYLTAENDSPNFRLRSSRKVGSGPVPLNGLRLMAQSHQIGGDVRVVWQSLTVRAEKLAGRALGQDRSVVARLNHERDKLQVKLAYDFRKTRPLPEDFLTWSSLDNWNPDDGWLSMRTVGLKTWHTTGIRLNHRIDGDFDITADFKIRQFEKPTGSNRATIHLAARLPDAIREQLSIIYTIDSAGQHDVIIESREPRRGGGYMFRPMEIVNLKDVTRMRIARRGNLMTVLVATVQNPDERVITSTECSTVPLARGALNFSVHAGDEGQTAHVLLHSLTIAAAKVDGSAVPPPPGQPAAPESLLDRALRLFGE
jgi:hypothetical protein